MNMTLQPIGGGYYTTETLPTGRYQVQIIGTCDVAIMESVDGVKFSRGKQFSVVDSACFVVDLPIGGQWYLRTTQNVTIKYID